jgi:hypothetical protein
MEKDFSLNLNNIPKELQLILGMISAKNEEELLPSWKGRMVDIDWDLFLELAMHHRLYPLLEVKLKSFIQFIIPEGVLKVLNSTYKFNTFRMLQLSGEVENVCRLLDSNGIDSLVLKGPILADDLYGDISLRTSGDLDILIPLIDLERAHKILCENGFEREENFISVLNDWKWRHHHVTYHHQNKQVKLEIHWKLNPGPGPEPSFRDLWSRKRVSSLVSYPINYLGKEDLFLFLVTHGARHGWFRLRWLVDIHRMVMNGFDWSSLRSLLKRYHYEHIGGQALLLSSHLLKTPLNDEMKILLNGRNSKKLASKALFYLEKMVNLHQEPVPENIYKYHKKYLFSLMSKYHKLIFIISCLHPYVIDYQTLPLPKKLHLLYFPLRPLLWFWRKTRNHTLFQKGT